ncbi:MAG: hypothetical protein WC845_00100 [Candidatus Staskawiczbacteria bacterium]
MAEFLDKTKPKVVWDIGSNMGLFSHISSKKGILTISLDSDPAAIEKNYLSRVKEKDTNCLPLWIDLFNPSPSIGWECKERSSLIQRGPADTILALALIHHLAISNNLPLDKIAEFLNEICRRSLIVEFIPKDDSQVERLLSTRKDIFPDYTQKVFENEFSKYFTIQSSEQLMDSKRTLYLMKKK